MNHEPDPRGVELPAPTAAPLILALGIALTAAGLALNYAFAVVGGGLFLAGLGQWIAQLLPGRGHVYEPYAERQPSPVRRAPHGVERLEVGMPGYRFRLPVRVHPVSSGVRGGLVGGLIMPLPALAWGLWSGHGAWYPLNLLAGMALPGVGELSVAELEQFRPALAAVAAAIHVTLSLTLGLIYGALMPTLPRIPKALAWGALLMPLLWTSASYAALSLVNPPVRALIEWPWFVVSQGIFGLVAALVFLRQLPRGPLVAGLLGGVAGGLMMPLPALAWSELSGHGVWYPSNLLAAMAMPHVREFTVAELERFRGEWLIAALAAHAVLALAFGLAFGLVLPRLPSIPAPIAWGGMLLPLLWTAASFGLMGVVNPVLQERVAWPWFIASQFVFGFAAALVVVRSEQVHVPPAGRGGEPNAR